MVRPNSRTGRPTGRELRQQGREALEKAIAKYEALGPLRPYDREAMTRVCELVAQGALLRDIAGLPGMPSERDVINWLMTEKEASIMMTEAREASAFSLESEAIAILRDIQARGISATDLRKVEALTQQLRWSAEKRHPRAFGPRPSVGLVVPIQINTTLDMGSGSGSGTADFPNVYALTPPSPEPAEPRVYEISATVPPPEDEPKAKRKAKRKTA